MQQLESLKRSIDNAQDLASVVRTMKTLAAVSIRQFEQAAESLSEYSQTIELGLRMVLWHLPESTPGQDAVDAGAEGWIVFGSDQGMCGQFNEQMAQFALQQLEQRPAVGEARFLVVGQRVAGRLADAGHNVEEILRLPSSASGIADLVIDLLAALDPWRQRFRLHRIVTLYNQRKSASTYQPRARLLLPLDPEILAPRSQRKWPSRTLPHFTQPPSALLSSLTRQYLFVMLFQAAAESLASENASRIASMQAAERNIQERLHDLLGEYHLLRQSAITEELLDVVTGYEALSQEG